MGTPRNPSYGMVDVRLLCNYRLAGIRLELFADMFNLLDNQDATRNQAFAARDPIRDQPPVGLRGPWALAPA